MHGSTTLDDLATECLGKLEYTADEDGSSELRGKLESLEKEKYLMFKALMGQFDKEREELLKKYTQSQELLASASKDLLHLVNENQNLKNKLKDALMFEPKVKL